MACRFPDFVHVGPPRTGTTWLHEVLKAHVNLPEPKETRFFDEFYRLGPTWYFEKFGAHPRHSQTGDLSRLFRQSASAQAHSSSHSELSDSLYLQRARRQTLLLVEDHSGASSTCRCEF